jgi:hypothetical protein
MTNPVQRSNPLYELEMEVLEEGREWMRQRLEQKLQKLAQTEGRISPPKRSADPERALPSARAAKLRR